MVTGVHNNSIKNKYIVKKAFFYKVLFENPVPLNMPMNYTTQPGSVIVEKMDGIFTKRVWQPYSQQTRSF